MATKTGVIEMADSKTTAKNYGDLMDYATGEYIRPATLSEREASDKAGPEGLIRVDGKTCFVQP